MIAGQQVVALAECSRTSRVGMREDVDAKNAPH